jgi:hypothetical protein
LMTRFTRTDATLLSAVADVGATIRTTVPVNITGPRAPHAFLGYTNAPT